MRTMTAADVAELVEGEVRGDSRRNFERVSPLETAGPEALSFIASARYLPYLHATRAGVILVTSTWAEAVPRHSVAVVVEDPYAAVQAVLLELARTPPPPPGIHPTAIVPASVRIGEGSSLGPYVVLGETVEIGKRTWIGPNCVVGDRCIIGDDVRIHPNVTLYDGVVLGDRVVLHSGVRVGTDGFGYIYKDGALQKVPQVGGCVIEEDVEVGANTAIDRGSIGDTLIGAGTKIDNLVHIAHNVQVGRNAALAGQVGIAGSARIGDGVAMGGQVGIGGHLTVGPGAKLAGQAGVIADVPAGETYSGYPARPHREALRAQAALFRLPGLLRRLKRLEQKVFGPERESND